MLVWLVGVVVCEYVLIVDFVMCGVVLMVVGFVIDSFVMWISGV